MNYKKIFIFILFSYMSHGINAMQTKVGTDQQVTNQYELAKISRSRTNDFSDAEKSFLLRHKTNLNCEFFYGKNLLHSAAEQGHLNKVKFLLENGADVNTHAEDDHVFFKINCTALHLAARGGHIEIVKLLLDYKANIHMKDSNGNNVLAYASCAFKDDDNLVRYLLKKGVDVNSRNKNGETALHLASLNRHNTKALQYLLRNNANVNLQDNRGLTPLSYVLSINGCQDLDVMRSFIEKKANANTTDVNTGYSCSNWTPLFYAVNKNDIGSAEFLLKNGALVDAQDFCGNTPLHYAVLRSTPDMIKLLLKYGANINHKAGMYTPLYRACSENKKDIAETLLKNGANVNAQESSPLLTSDVTVIKKAITSPKVKEAKPPYFAVIDDVYDNPCEFTPLHVAAFKGHEALLDLLIQYKADVNSRTLESGITPLHVAAHKGRSEIVKKLLKAGAKGNAETREAIGIVASTEEEALHHISGGVTALFSAINSGYCDVVKMLAPCTNVNKEIGFGVTPLHCAAQLGNLDIVKELLKNRADFKAAFCGKFNAIQIALSRNNKEVAQLLTEKLFVIPTNKLQLKNIEIKQPFENMKVIRQSHAKGFTESVIHKICYENNCPFPGQGGIFYRTAIGFQPVPEELKKQMPFNHLSNLNYDKCPKMKNENDIRHSFPVEVEKNCGDWAWVLIDTSKNKPNIIADKTKKFDLYITLYGRLLEENENKDIVKQYKHTEELGAFEFTVRKSPYEEKGNCFHRFFAPKGTVGASGFGAEYRDKKTTC